MIRAILFFIAISFSTIALSQTPSIFLQRKKLCVKADIAKPAFIMDDVKEAILYDVQTQKKPNVRNALNNFSDAVIYRMDSVKDVSQKTAEKSLWEIGRLHNKEAAPNIQPKHALRPIPQSQIDAVTTGPAYPQNPGWLRANSSKHIQA